MPTSTEPPFCNSPSFPPPPDLGWLDEFVCEGASTQASWFLGVCEWTFGALLFAGFWDKRLGAAGSTATFIGTVTIIPFMPDGWDPAVGFPAMTGNVPFLMKDVVLLAVSFYLLKQDVLRVAQHDPVARRSQTAGLVHSR